MTHPIERAASRIVTELRLDHSPRREKSTLHLVPGVYLSWDEDNGDVSLDVRPELGLLMRLHAKVRKAPGWLSLNIGLGEAKLASGDVLGLVIEMEGCEGETIAPFIRTARDGVLGDTRLQDKLEGCADREIRTLLHTVRVNDPVAHGPGYHTLVLPLPKRDFGLELRDLRLFVLPGAGKQLAAARLGET